MQIVNKLYNYVLLKVVVPELCLSTTFEIREIFSRVGGVRDL
jgi:hypothetical protein